MNPVYLQIIGNVRNLLVEAKPMQFISTERAVTCSEYAEYIKSIEPFVNKDFDHKLGILGMVNEAIEEARAFHDNSLEKLRLPMDENELYALTNRTYSEAINIFKNKINSKENSAFWEVKKGLDRLQALINITRANIFGKLSLQSIELCNRVQKDFSMMLNEKEERTHSPEEFRMKAKDLLEEEKKKVVGIGRADCIKSMEDLIDLEANKKERYEKSLTDQIRERVEWYATVLIWYMFGQAFFELSSKVNCLDFFPWLFQLAGSSCYITCIVHWFFCKLFPTLWEWVISIVIVLVIEYGLPFFFASKPEDYSRSVKEKNPPGGYHVIHCNNCWSQVFAEEVSKSVYSKCSQGGKKYPVLVIGKTMWFHFFQKPCLLSVSGGSSDQEKRRLKVVYKRLERIETDNNTARITFSGSIVTVSWTWGSSSQTSSQSLDEIFRNIWRSVTPKDTASRSDLMEQNAKLMNLCEKNHPDYVKKREALDVREQVLSQREDEYQERKASLDKREKEQEQEQEILDETKKLVEKEMDKNHPAKWCGIEVRQSEIPLFNVLAVIALVTLSSMIWFYVSPHAASNLVKIYFVAGVGLCGVFSVLLVIKIVRMYKRNNWWKNNKTLSVPHETATRKREVRVKVE